MYIIRHNCCLVDIGGKPIKGYFIGFWEYGLVRFRNYGLRKEAMKFETKQEAIDFWKNQLASAPEHDIVRF